MNVDARYSSAFCLALLFVTAGAGCSGDDSATATEASSTAASASTSSDTISTTGDTTDTSGDSTTSSGTTATTGPETTSTASGTTTNDTTSTTGSLPDDIPEPFNQYCVATFTEAYEPPYMGFSIAPGESFLYVFTINEYHEMKYFGDEGPVSFDFEAPKDNLPFMTNCESLSFVDDYLAVLADVTLYLDKEMTEVACELSAGTVTPYDAGGGYGAAEFVEGGIIFEYEYFALSEICDGHDLGYAFVPEVVFFDTLKDAHPLDRISAP